MIRPPLPPLSLHQGPEHSRCSPGEIVAFEFPEAGAGLASAQEEGGLSHVLPHPCDGS